MTEPILEPDYWRKRLADARERHHAVFCCPLGTWQAIEAKHREILTRHIKPCDSVLDAGCAWGRLLDLLPDHWKGTGGYLGVDLSPDFIALARKEHPDYVFRISDLRAIDNRLDDNDTSPNALCLKFDWAVLISIRPMVKRNLGDEVWAAMETELRRVAKRLLLLEYDPASEGSVE